MSSSNHLQAFEVPAFLEVGTPSDSPIHVTIAAALVSKGISFTSVTPEAKGGNNRVWILFFTDEETKALPEPKQIQCFIVADRTNIAALTPIIPTEGSEVPTVSELRDFIMPKAPYVRILDNTQGITGLSLQSIFPFTDAKIDPFLILAAIDSVVQSALHINNAYTGKFSFCK